MASITQKVPNYVLGVSTQPDEKKLPGQVVELTNGIPDVVRQLEKRPGGHLIGKIVADTGSNTKWFNIYTLNDLQYIGQAAPDGAVKIWRCSDGVEIPVDYDLVPGTNKATYLDNSALSDEKSTDIQVQTINETTIFVNRRKNTAMLSAVGDLSPAQLNEAFIALDTISYGKQYALDIFDQTDNTTFTYKRAVSVEVGTVDDAADYSGTSNGDCLGMGRETIDISSGRGIFATSPPTTTALTGTYVRSGTTVTATITNHGYQVGESVTIDFTSGGAADGTFIVTSAADANTFTITHGSSGTITTSNLSIPKGRTNLRYEMDIRCTPQPTGTVDDSYTYHDTYQAFPKLQFGGEGWEIGDSHQYTSEKGVTTTVKVLRDVTVTSRCNVAGVRPRATASTADEHVSSGGILGDMKATLDAISGTGITATICGNGLHLYRATPFGVTTPEKTLMSITTTEVNNISDLPRVCRHGYVVRVVNSGEDMDDYYLRFQAEGITANISKACIYSRSGTTVTVGDLDHGLSNGDTVFIDFTDGGATDGHYTVSNVSSGSFDLANNTTSGTIASGATCTYTPARFGEGVWEEVVAPGIETTLDKDTMPLKLTRALPGTYDTINSGVGTTSYPNGFFRFDYPDWGERDVGDDITNSKPTFVGKPIQKLGFYRNRIALLSEENVILSRVNDFYNFWVKTAMAISNADPIDLQSSSTFPTKLYDSVDANGGLVLFSANEQFILNSGAEALLTPETAKVSYLSSYAFNPDTRPFSLGTTIGFLNSTARNARFYEMGGITGRDDPQVAEQTKIISNLFPTNTTLPAESTENDLILFGVDGSIHTATNEVWGYKFFTAGDKRVQSAWFKWIMPNVIAFHTIMDDIYYAVLKNGSDYTLERFDLKLNSNTLMIGTAPDENRIHLDTKKTIASADITYNANTEQSSFTLGDGYYSSNTLTAYIATDSDNAGKSYDIPTVHLDKTFAASAVNTTAETITIASHTLVTGNPVTYQEGSSAVAGLTDNTVYYVIRVDDDTIKLATSNANANAGTAINLTSQGGGTHTLEVPTVTLPGNWKTSTKDGSSVNTDVIIGYEYEMKVQLPKIYVTQSSGDKISTDTRGSLVIHRLNFAFGDVGVIDITLKRRGRNDYTQTYESIEWDNYKTDEKSIADDYIHSIPVYDRNTNLDVILKSNHPSPASIHSMNWEGDYSPRYYQRV